MQLHTQIRRFMISSALFAVIAGVIAAQPHAEDRLGELNISELPVIIIVDKEPSSEPNRAWRQMLPASLGTRRS